MKIVFHTEGLAKRFGGSKGDELEVPQDEAEHFCRIGVAHPVKPAKKKATKKRAKKETRANG